MEYVRQASLFLSRCSCKVCLLKVPFWSALDETMCFSLGWLSSTIHEQGGRAVRGLRFGVKVFKGNQGL